MVALEDFTQRNIRVLDLHIVPWTASYAALCEIKCWWVFLKARWPLRNVFVADLTITENLVFFFVVLSSHFQSKVSLEHQLPTVTQVQFAIWFFFLSGALQRVLVLTWFNFHFFYLLPPSVWLRNNYCILKWISRQMISTWFDFSFLLSLL